MEKDLDMTEKKTTDEDDEENLNTKNTSKKVKRSDTDEYVKKPDKPSSFFVVSPDGETLKDKEKPIKLDARGVDDASAEDLTENEVRKVIQIIIDEREQTVSDELANADDGSSDELEAVAAGIF